MLIAYLGSVFWIKVGCGRTSTLPPSHGCGIEAFALLLQTSVTQINCANEACTPQTRLSERVFLMPRFAFHEFLTPYTLMIIASRFFLLLSCSALPLLSSKFLSLIIASFFLSTSYF